MKTDITECLPYKECQNCQNFLLNVNERTIFTESGRIEVKLEVSCKNEHICKFLNGGFAK